MSHGRGYNDPPQIPSELVPWIVGAVLGLGFFAFIGYQIASAVGADWGTTCSSLVSIAIATAGGFALSFYLGWDYYRRPYWVVTAWLAAFWLCVCRVADTIPMYGSYYGASSGYYNTQRMPWETARSLFTSESFSYHVVSFVQNPWSFWIIMISLIVATVLLFVDYSNR